MQAIYLFAELKSSVKKAALRGKATVLERTNEKTNGKATVLERTNEKTHGKANEISDL